MWWINTEISDQKWHYSKGYPKKALCGAWQGLFFTVVTDLQNRTLYKDRPVCEACLESQGQQKPSLS